jgi:hypothetical protein
MSSYILRVRRYSGVKVIYRVNDVKSGVREPQGEAPRTSEEIHDS